MKFTLAILATVATVASAQPWNYGPQYPQYAPLSSYYGRPVQTYYGSLGTVGTGGAVTLNENGQRLLDEASTTPDLRARLQALVSGALIPALQQHTLSYGSQYIQQARNSFAPAAAPATSYPSFGGYPGYSNYYAGGYAGGYPSYYGGNIGSSYYGGYPGFTGVAGVGSASIGVPGSMYSPFSGGYSPYGW